MNDHPLDHALIQVLAVRFEKMRLPLAIDLLDKVDRGDTLNTIDIWELEDSFNDFNRIKPIIDRNHEWQLLACRMVTLYHSITSRALENETHQSGS